MTPPSPAIEKAAIGLYYDYLTRIITAANEAVRKAQRRADRGLIAIWNRSIA